MNPIGRLELSCASPGGPVWWETHNNNTRQQHLKNSPKHENTKIGLAKLGQNSKAPKLAKLGLAKVGHDHQVTCCVPVSVKRLDQNKDADEIVDANHVRTRRLVYEQLPGLFTQCEDIDIQFRVSGLLHVVVKQAETFHVRELDRESSSSTNSSSRLTKQRPQPIR